MSKYKVMDNTSKKFRLTIAIKKWLIKSSKIMMQPRIVFEFSLGIRYIVTAFDMSLYTCRRRNISCSLFLYHLAFYRITIIVIHIPWRDTRPGWPDVTSAPHQPKVVLMERNNLIVVTWTSCFYLSRLTECRPLIPLRYASTRIYVVLHTYWMGPVGLLVTIYTDSRFTHRLIVGRQALLIRTTIYLFVYSYSNKAGRPANKQAWFSSSRAIRLHMFALCLQGFRGCVYMRARTVRPPI
jgi:hypothetical protein